LASATIPSTFEDGTGGGYVGVGIGVGVGEGVGVGVGVGVYVGVGVGFCATPVLEEQEASIRLPSNTILKKSHALR